MAAKAKLIWSDKSVYILLDLLQSRQSLWNTKHESYRNRSIKKGSTDHLTPKDGPTICASEIRNRA